MLNSTEKDICVKSWVAEKKSWVAEKNKFQLMQAVALVLLWCGIEKNDVSLEMSSHYEIIVTRKSSHGWTIISNVHTNHPSDQKHRPLSSLAFIVLYNVELSKQH
jgi:hypothetical protein